MWYWDLIYQKSGAYQSSKFWTRFIFMLSKPSSIVNVVSASNTTFTVVVVLIYLHKNKLLLLLYFIEINWTQNKNQEEKRKKEAYYYFYQFNNFIPSNQCQLETNLTICKRIIKHKTKTKQKMLQQLMQTWNKYYFQIRSEFV